MKDTLGRTEILPVKEARQMLVELCSPLSQEEVSLEDAFGRVLAEDVFSSEDLPGFDRSTVDGYAVKAEDTYGAGESLPVLLELKGYVNVGEDVSISINHGQTLYVPTGGMLPEGADSVVMIEYTEKLDEGTVAVYRSVSVGENVIKSDEDIREGEKVFSKGHKLRPQDVAALSALGITRIKVYRRPHVAIIPTGDEVVPPGVPKKKAEVRDVNSFTLSGMVLSEGAVPVRFPVVRDDRDALKDTLQRAIEQADVVLITGGSSVGTRDYTREVVESLGPPGVLFHGVQMRPGKPLLGASVEDRFVFGLPGHPVAVGICFDEFVRPVLRRLSGLATKDFIPERKTLKARLRVNIPSRPGLREYVRVRLVDERGTLWAEPVFGKSGLIRTLVSADGVVPVPEDSNGLYEGETVEVLLFE